MKKGHKAPHPYSFDIISIGEAGLDTFLMVDEASVLCSVDKTNCWICFTYADKIPVREHHYSMGHNACNNAVGMARLGLKAALHCVIGDDDTGEKIRKNLSDENVNCAYVTSQKHSMSTCSTILSYKTERTIFIYHPSRNHITTPSYAPSRWFYLTSLGKIFQPIHAHVLTQLKKNGTLLAFNPGDQQLRAGRQALDRVLRACTLLIVNKEEAGMLLQRTIKDADVPKALFDLHMLGPEKIIITDGSKGAYSYENKRAHHTKIAQAKVKERTGAGDAFSTGVLAALCYGKTLAQALEWGTINSASVIEHIGPQKGLLTKQKLLKRLHTSRCTAKPCR